jgi:hypothetical protein
VSSLVSHPKRRYTVKGVWEHGADENIWKLHNDELHSLYPSQNIVRVIKSRRMKWAGHVARMGEGRGAYRVFGWEAQRQETIGKILT